MSNNWDDAINTLFTNKKDSIEKSMKKNQNEFIAKVGKANKKLKVRFLLNKHTKNLEVSYYTVFYHYQIKQYGLVCLNKTYGQPCHICKVIDKMQKDLKSKGIHEGDDWKQLAKWYPNALYYMAAYVRGTVENPVKYIELNNKMRDYVLGKMLKNPNIWHPINGKDFVLEFKTEGKMFGEKTIEIDDDKSPLANDESTILSIIDQVQDFWKLYKSPTYDEIKRDFDSGISDMGIMDGGNEKSPTESLAGASIPEEKLNTPNTEKKPNRTDEETLNSFFDGI